MRLDVLMNSMLIDTTKKHHSPLKPTGNRDQPRLLACALDATAMASSSKKEGFDKRVHRFPALLGIPVKVVPFVEIVGHVTRSNHMDIVCYSLFLP